MNNDKKVMRDILIDKIRMRMHEDEKIFFLSADFGSPKLDALREEFSGRFINVGIAEQNLVNISAGIALEGFTVYAYAIAPFLTMRAFEQIRINLALHGQIKEMNVNLIGVGAGLSYDVSGPTHHCLEDISVMRTLPNMIVFSPSDYVTAEAFADYSVSVKKPKYLRFDGKATPAIYESRKEINMEKGFCEIKKGKSACIVSTGYMTHKALKVSETLKRDNIDIGVVDIFLLSGFDVKSLSDTLKRYETVCTLEEAFIGKGGLDALIAGIICGGKNNMKMTSFGFKDKYVFDIGDREYLHKINGLDEDSIAEAVRKITE